MLSREQLHSHPTYRQNLVRGVYAKLLLATETSLYKPLTVDAKSMHTNNINTDAGLAALEIS